MVVIKNISPDKPIICWWSGGVTSAVACWLATTAFGHDNCRVVFIDTHNEHPDTYSFKNQCSKWYKTDINSICSDRYNSIEDVWREHLSLNTATGAICSYHLKRMVRLAFQNNNSFSYQVFGYDIDEIKRAKAMALNNPDAMPIFPLINDLYNKKDCIKIIEKENNLFHPLTIPSMYKMGFNNNNCWETGCVQAGIGYWQKMQREQPDKFNKMALVEHELTNLKGAPVTMLKDQSKDGGLLFLKPHPLYPNIKDISLMKGREPKPLLDCNGFCGSNDLQKNETELEINFA